MSVAIVIWKKFNINGVMSKTRIAKEINNNDLANELSDLMFYTIVENIKELKCDKFVYHQRFKSYDLVDIPVGVNSLEEDDKLDMQGNIIRSFELLFRQGYDEVILMVSDAPLITEKHIKHVIKQLRKYTVVISPSVDKGFNIIGIKRTDNLDWFKSNNFVSRSKSYNLLNELTINLSRMSIPYITTDETFDDIDEVRDIKKLWLDLKKTGVNNELFKFIKKNYNKFKLNEIDDSGVER